MGLSRSIQAIHGDGFRADHQTVAQTWRGKRARQLNEDPRGEIVGFLWRKTKALLTSSEESGDYAQTLMQDSVPATSYFHRPPAVARFQSTRVPSFRFVLVAAHVTWNGFEDKKGEEARGLELRNPRALLRRYKRQKRRPACGALGISTRIPNDKAWSYFRKQAGRHMSKIPRWSCQTTHTIISSPASSRRETPTN